MLTQVFEILSAPFRTALELPLKVLSAPKRLWGLTLPTRVAIATLVVGLLILGVDYYYWLMRTRESGASWHYGYAAGVIVALSIAVYFAVHVWLERDESQFPQIDEAWNAALNELAVQGLDLDEVPLYLVLGPHDAATTQALMAASGGKYSAAGQGLAPGAPLYVFGSAEAAFIVCTVPSELSRISSLASLAPVIKGNQSLKTIDPVARVYGGTMTNQPGPSGRSEFPDFGGPKTPYTETAGPESRTGGADSQIGPPAAAPQYRAQATMAPGYAPGSAPMTFSGAPSRPQAVTHEPVKLSPEVARTAREQLEYVCRLIRKARQPYCPINGVLTVLPYSLLERSDLDAVALQKAVRSDLDQIQEAFRQRCQVISLIGGMEKEDGFLELMRRVGPEASKSQRFGKGFNPWNAPTPEQLEAVARHACGAFEDFTYALFADRRGYEKIGNPRLYELLCKVRLRIANRVADLLANAYGRDPDPGRPQPLLFGGCYFGATGKEEDKQVFIRSVFEKLIEQQDYVDWAESALSEDRRYQHLANICFTISGVLLLLIIGIIGLHFYLPHR